MEKIPSYKPCFFCGKENPYGLQLNLFAEGEEIRSEFQVAERYCGLQGFIHGAILFGVLDEVMWWAASWQQSSACLTVEMTVRYRRPAPIDRRYQASARVAEDRNRVIKVVGEIKELTSMEICVTGKGKYYLLTGERNREIISSMDFSRCSPQTRSKYEGRG
ncbi:MAG: PaaI family thioesterase [Deltaproteobacteria bacterium]|nr:MAG: PaaI family thioesterase [Deltaproteobacteria bacterium]